MWNVNLVKTREAWKPLELAEIRKSSKDVFKGCRLEENDRLSRLQT